MTRLHPFDYVFGGPASEWLMDIRREAAATGQDPSDLALFARLPAVQRILGDMQGPEASDAAGQAGGGAGPSPEVPEAYLYLLWAAYRFWDTGSHTLQVSLRAIEEGLRAPPSSAAPTIPHGACYLQLPERAFWSQGAAAAPHEPLDGLFAVSGLQGRELLVLGVLGLRPERRGFTQIVATAVPDDFAAARAHARRPPFAPAMAGGDAAGFRSVASIAELLWLAYLALAQSQE